MSSPTKVLLVWPSAEFSTYDVATGIRAGLIEAGHEVADYRLYQRIRLMSAALHDWAPDGQQVSVELACYHASEALPFAAIRNNCRWALVISGMGLHPEGLQALRRIGVKVAVWFTEAPYNTDDDRELYLARFADLAFVNERTSVGAFQRVVGQHGGTAHYLPHAYNPTRHYPGPAEQEHACDVLLVGTGFAERQVLLEAVDWTGIDLRLGGLWKGIQRPSQLAEHVRYPCLDNSDTVRLYHSAKIVLNPHRWAEGAESANPRVYEAAACGAFQISDHRAEITELLGDAVPTYEPGVPWQLAALIRRYLADPAERSRKAVLAQERIHGNTFAARARSIVGAIEEYECRQAGRLIAMPALVG